jgi:hypothetical protein
MITPVSRPIKGEGSTGSEKSTKCSKNIKSNRKEEEKTGTQKVSSFAPEREIHRNGP